MRYVVFNVQSGTILCFAVDEGTARKFASTYPNHFYTKLKWHERLWYWFQYRN